MEAEVEFWVKVPGYEEHYEISNMGRLRSFDRWIANKKGAPVFYESRIMKTPKGGSYCQGVLRKPGVKPWSFRVHRLVAEIFVHRPSGKDYVDHISGDTADNRASNLRWCTCKENTYYGMYETRTIKVKGTDHPMSKLTEDDVRAIRLELAEGATQKSLSLKYGVKQSNISSIYRGKIWGHI